MLYSAVKIAMTSIQILYGIHNDFPKNISKNIRQSAGMVINQSYAYASQLKRGCALLQLDMNHPNTGQMNHR